MAPFLIIKMEQKKTNRRRAIQITAAGLVHLSASAVTDAAELREGDLLLKRARERGFTDLGWLKSYHSFSFGRYFDPEAMNFRSLRVINDDRVAPGRGFPTHPHKNMEILSYVLEGALEHRDSTGVGSIIRPDQVQYMSAGRGITHSEFNPSRRELSHFLQVWIQPKRRGGKPRYRQEDFEEGRLESGLTLLASGEGAGGSIELHQDARMLAARPQPGRSVEYTVERGRHAWLQVARGKISVNGTPMAEGDALASTKPVRLVIQATGRGAEVVLFDLG